MLKKLTFIDWLVIIGGLYLCTGMLQSDTGNPYANFLARSGNIVLFLYILWRVAGKALINFFSHRRQSIADDLSSAELQKKNAEQHLAQLEQDLSDIEEKRQAILLEAQKQAEALKADILAKAQAEVVTMKERAQQQMALQADSQRKALREELANELAKQLEAMLRSKISPQQHSALIDQALKKVAL